MAQKLDKLADDPRYKGKVDILLCNLASLNDGDTYAKTQSLKGHATPCSGRPPSQYGLKYIPHHTVIDRAGVVVKNAAGGCSDLEATLDSLLAEAKKDD